MNRPRLSSLLVCAETHFYKAEEANQQASLYGTAAGNAKEPWIAGALSLFWFC